MASIRRQNVHFVMSMVALSFSRPFRRVKSSLHVSISLTLSLRRVPLRRVVPLSVALCNYLSHHAALRRIMPPPFVAAYVSSSQRMSLRRGVCLFVAAYYASSSRRACVSSSRRMSLRRSVCLFVGAYVSSSRRGFFAPK